jgi:hypothetical protein
LHPHATFFVRALKRNGTTKIHTWLSKRVDAFGRLEENTTNVFLLNGR